MKYVHLQCELLQRLFPVYTCINLFILVRKRKRMTHFMERVDGIINSLIVNEYVSFYPLGYQEIAALLLTLILLLTKNI